MAGHAGHSGSQSSGSGGVGAVGGGDFVPVLPDRVDLPFVTETVDVQVTTPIPIQISIKISGQILPIGVYPDRRWSAEWRAWYALSEYVQTDWRDIALDPWPDPTVPTDPRDPTSLSEIQELVEAAQDERADALGEIVAQHDAFASYFFALLTVDPALYPATNLLVNIASIVAAFTVLYFKNGAGNYEPRQRPSQVCPPLLPPVPVPGHPSYPSGHATEAHLIALVLNDVFSTSDPKTISAITSDLAALATRIARNREIAGLHYPSDSTAGKTLAEGILPLLQSIDCYADNIDKARSEWAPE
jgi:hypothetical protein